MNRKEFNRRATDKTIYFGGLRDVDKWITKILIGLSIWVFTNMAGEFKDLKLIVTSLSLDNVSIKQKIENIVMTQERYRKEFDELNKKVWRK